MEYIKKLKELNIKFEIINEQKAMNILKKDCSYLHFMQLSNLFDKYKFTEKKGKFVNLDFGQLYYLHLIDKKTSKILMNLCLELERNIKTNLLYSANKLGVSNSFLKHYIEIDYEYLSKNYKDIDNFLDSASKNEENELLAKFLDDIMFGTFEKIVNHFYSIYSDKLDITKIDVEKYLNSVHNIRNRVAHNLPLLPMLVVRRRVLNDTQVYQLLESNGINNKMLSTNLSKTLIFDSCNILHLAYILGVAVNLKKELTELCYICRKYGKYYKKNENLRSCYEFLKKTVKIYCKKY